MGSVLACLTGPVSAQTEGLRELEAFLSAVQQGRAAFTQTVTAPVRDGEPVARTRTSRGEFEFLRPDRFRFRYTEPFEQVIVADGQTLWLYDPDLNQVTARRQAEVLANTPAALLAAAPDLRAVRRAFTLSAGESRDGLNWVEAVPVARDGQVQRIRIGFRQGQLEVLDILDSFGQRSIMRFGPLDRSTQFTAAHFRFQPPAGAEVLRQ
ncbi:MAG: outer membrane lipoprotein chaperone LolA [Tepidimonas sp.]|uniref:outer membrane lipoprotein chaperone LolA n=1 Tax=Tepidimonas sp. TaxID=2002775 RepID=UPI00259DC8F1|nr:outer membrane lipoprotein chaperone LolA [Tepidimonas sp.]MDM7456303.1 outer membrane lipoprotein chaperone LolA [Tepidimonas sp.]